MIRSPAPSGDKTILALLAGVATILLTAAAPAPAVSPPAPAPSSAVSSTPDKPAEKPAEKPDRQITDKTVTAGDVATTPLSDLNIRKQGIPQLLLDAEVRPYTLAGMTSCPRLARAVGGLDAILGDDIDVQQAKGQAISPGGVAQSVVGSFIPFRGLIRELSGANAQERKVQAAIYAGTARRAFLKGVGLSRGCHAPARPATR